jgi:hypothetical protein
MAMRWASGVLVGLGVAGLLPTSATAQGVAEPMPMHSHGGWAPTFYQGAPAPGGYAGGPGMPGMPGGPGMMPPGGMPPGMMPPGGMPPGGMPPGMGMPPGGPGMPMVNPASCGPNGMPGVDLQMGATYYPGISGHGGLCGWFKDLFYCDSGERKGLYAKVGYLGLKRNGLPDRPLVAIEDPFVIDTSDPDNPFIRPTTDGDPVTLFAGAPFIENLSGLSAEYNNGVQFAIGLQDSDNCFMLELAGFFISHKSQVSDVRAPGRLDAPYFNAPAGFQDTAGLWLNADYMHLAFSNSVSSAELNLRWFGSTWGCFDLNYLVGLRYVKLYEKFTHYTIDDDFQFFVDDPTTRATLSYKAENDLFGAQIGFGLTQWLSQTWSWSFEQKFAFLANAAKTQNRLIRDDGFVGFDFGRTTERFATAYEGGMFLNFGSGSWRVRGGYEYKLFVGVASVDQQFTYDLLDAAFRHKSTDTIIYHGPSASIEWVF